MPPVPRAGGRRLPYLRGRGVRLMHAFLHWLNVEYWSVSWPNVFAPSFWTLIGVGVSHLSLRRQQKRHHDEHMQALGKDKR